MKNILILSLLFASAFSFGQTGKTCLHCPPSPVGHIGECLQVDSNGHLAWLPCGGTGNFWKTTGNSGTNPASNFIGTTDNVALLGKVNSVASFFIDNANENTANTLFGYNSLQTYLLNSNNSAFGASSLSNVQDSIGYVSDGNAAIGYASLGNLLSGSGNTAIGALSGTGSSLLYSTAIGARSKVGCDSCIVLGDTTATNGVGIGTAYPSAKLDVRGNVKIADGTQGAGKVLQSNSAGLASWGVTAFTQSDSATIYATTPAVGTTYMCTNCSGTGITGRVVTYYSGAWRRTPVSLLID